MKKVIKLALLFTIVMYSSSVFAQKVLVKELQGTYEGDEKKGLANGEGKAVGDDTYEGKFKKGLPNGKGVYTWGDHEVYLKFEGTFVKGKKEGAGKLTLKSGDIQKGFWIDDEFIYDIEFEKGSGINRIQVQQGTSKTFEVKFNMSVRESKGNKSLNFYQHENKFTNVQYPFEKEMEVNLDGRWVIFTISIFKPGNWMVYIYR